VSLVVQFFWNTVYMLCEVFLRKELPFGSRGDYTCGENFSDVSFSLSRLIPYVLH